MVLTTRAAAPFADVERHGQVAYRKLLWVAPLAAAVAVVVNVALFAIGQATGIISDTITVTPDKQPLPAGAVAAFSIVGVVGATIVYALLGRFTRRPIRIFTIVAAVVLVLSFASPFSLPGIGAAYVALLNLMHIVVAAASVGLLTTLARRD